MGSISTSRTGCTTTSSSHVFLATLLDHLDRNLHISSSKLAVIHAASTCRSSASMCSCSCQTPCPLSQKGTRHAGFCSLQRKSKIARQKDRGDDVIGSSGSKEWDLQTDTYMCRAEEDSVQRPQQQQQHGKHEDGTARRCKRRAPLLPSAPQHQRLHVLLCLPSHTQIRLTEHHGISKALPLNSTNLALLVPAANRDQDTQHPLRATAFVTQNATANPTTPHSKEASWTTQNRTPTPVVFRTEVLPPHLRIGRWVPATRYRERLMQSKHNAARITRFSCRWWREDKGGQFAAYTMYGRERE